MKKIFFFICFFLVFSSVESQMKHDSAKLRKEISLNSSWKTIIISDPLKQEETFVINPKIDANWEKTDVPHNWDQYYG